MPLPVLPGSRILIAASESAPSIYLAELLGTWGHVVEVVRDGRDALRKVYATEAPEILLMDEDLAGMSAVDIVQEIRFRSNNQNVWTMVMSTDPSCEQVMSATDAGVDDFLAKPVDELDLRIRLHTAKRVRELRARLDQSLEDARFHTEHDHLTGLLNREALLRLLFQETDRVQRMRTPLSLILLDLDRFSCLNLDYGYAAGDRVLQQLADRFRRYLRSYDLIGRCGEDEFLIALPGCPLDESVRQAERLLRLVVRRPFDVPGAVVHMTASFGVSQSKGRSPLVVLREAERALADAKLGGRNLVRAFSAAQTSISAPTSTISRSTEVLAEIAAGEAPDRSACRLHAGHTRNALSDGKS